MTTIRPYSEADVNAILDIWLQASIKAHDFVAAEFWQSQVDNMRDIYIPASTTLVCESDSDSDSGSGSDLSSSVIGFYSLYESTLADEHTGHQEYSMIATA